MTAAAVVYLVCTVAIVTGIAASPDRTFRGWFALLGPLGSGCVLAFHAL